MISVNKEHLVEMFDRMTPDTKQRSRMRGQILYPEKSDTRTRSARHKKMVWRTVTAVCIMTGLLGFLLLPLAGRQAEVYAIHVLEKEKDGATFRLMDIQKSSENYGTSVSQVDSRPELEFYIHGRDIAKIEMKTENEYLYAEDWTKTQHEKYWNTEYYQRFDEEKQISIADFSKLYDKKLVMTFKEDFQDYDQIWFRWTAYNLYQWAAADNFAHFLGYGIHSNLDDLSEKDKTKLAADNDGSAVGHIQLEGYPEKLTRDTISITITDRKGNVTTRTIHIKVSNNELKQTVVTASLGEE